MRASRSLRVMRAAIARTCARPRAWIRRYFDPGGKQTVDAIAQLKQLSTTSISFEMPSISESLDAVRGFKSRRPRAPG